MPQDARRYHVLCEAGRGLSRPVFLFRGAPKRLLQGALLWPFVERANERAFQVALDGRCEMQMTEYSARDGDHYGWHHDVQWHGQSGVDRKLSVTVQLSDPDGYTGGELEFEELETNADFRARGTVLMFPSYLRHRIRPVTAGSRKALVAWFSGPRWT